MTTEDEKILESLTYKEKLLTETQIGILLMICKEKLTYPEIAKKLQIKEGTLRKYIQTLRQKLDPYNLENASYFLEMSKIPNFDISLLWQNFSNYEAIKCFIERAIFNDWEES